MIVLKGITLGDRQRELNEKVNEAAAQPVKFNDIKDTPEIYDVDKLFKIDLASKFANIDYIIEVLRSGDSLYISRALKCTWIYDDCHSKIISVENIHNNVIPFMSIKMKKKLLTAISANVRDETRAAVFFKYCIDIKLITIALKFLNFTNDTFKLEALNNPCCKNLILESESENIKHFIGLSFTVAEAYVKAFSGASNLQLFRELSYLYTVSEEKYMDMVEKYVVVINRYNNTYLGLRISRSIMKKHKDRVLKKPSPYVKILKKRIIQRYCTEEDAKIFAVGVLPEYREHFWYDNYCDKYKFLIDKITVGKYQFVKQIFTTKYPEKRFESTAKFYRKQLYNLMTTEEREIWALTQIASGKEILGIGKDYLLYKFVNFDKAFEEINKLVVDAPDYTTRAEMMLTLVDTAKNHSDIKKLLKHYHENHGYEQRCIKENFIDRVSQNFNVFQFDEDCWEAFNNIYHNIGVYHVLDYRTKAEYKMLVIVHCIIKQKEMPEVIKRKLNGTMQFYTVKHYTNKLTKEQQDTVFNYLFNYYMDEIKQYENVPYDDKVKCHLRVYIRSILELLYQYDMTKEDCPELINKFMKLDWSEFSNHNLFRVRIKNGVTPEDLLSDLKGDANILVEHLPHVKMNIDGDYMYDMSTLLKKLKIYFSNDIAKHYLKFFESLLNGNELGHRVAQAAAYGIFQLADEKYKIDFMAKYAPKDATIDYSEIDDKLLRIQQAICAHACHSRPPVPIKSILAYIKGDYVDFCVPMFPSYLANLPLPLCMEFIEAILYTPVSIQKHTIRLAFECFSAESFNTVILRVWNKTKKVSLRKIIYKAIFSKISKVKSGQDSLFNTLKDITLRLRPDDDEEIFCLLISRQLPDHLMPEFINVAWQLLSQFPPKQANLTRLRNLIMFMCTQIDTIRTEFVCGIIEQFIATVFVQEQEHEIKLNEEAAAVIDAKWKLSATFITSVKDKDDLDIKMQLTKRILKECLKGAGVHKRKRALLKICFNFIHELENTSYCQDYQRYANVNMIMQLVLETLQEGLAIEEIYMTVWEIRLGIAARKVIAESKVKQADEEGIDQQVIKDIATNFANELGMLITELVEKELYFATFSIDIKNKIISKTQTLKNLIDTKTKFTDMMTNVCLGLTSFNVTQIYLLVLSLLPANCRNEYKEEFKAIIIKVNKMDNKEIRCNLYRKLGDSDVDTSA